MSNSTDAEIRVALHRKTLWLRAKTGDLTNHLHDVVIDADGLPPRLIARPDSFLGAFVDIFVARREGGSTKKTVTYGMANKHSAMDDNG